MGKNGENEGGQELFLSLNPITERKTTLKRAGNSWTRTIPRTLKTDRKEGFSKGNVPRFLEEGGHFLYVSLRGNVRPAYFPRGQIDHFETAVGGEKLGVAEKPTHYIQRS